MRSSTEVFWLPLFACGLALGFVAWPGTTWGGALSILLPFMCGLQPTRFRALALSAGYYLGALGPYAASGFRGIQGVSGWEWLASTCLTIAFSAMAWALTGGRHPTTFRRFITLLSVWLVTIITPMGGWGLAHPSLGWLIVNKGGMGPLTFVISGVLTSILVAAICRERDRREPVRVISGRSLSAAICATVILGGSFDQTAAPSHAGPVAAVSTYRSQGETQRAAPWREQALRLEVLLGKLALVNQHHDPIQLVFAPQRYFEATSSMEREATLQELRAMVARHKIGLVVHLPTDSATLLQLGSSKCTALLPSTLTITITFRGRICSVQVVTADSSARASSSPAMQWAQLAELEVANQQWPQDEPKPFLELWSAFTASTHHARIVVFSIADHAPWRVEANRFVAKHMLLVAWAARTGVVSETAHRKSD